jgi:hypothetical protein
MPTLLNPAVLAAWAQHISQDLSLSLLAATEPQTVLTNNVCDELNSLFNELSTLMPTRTLLKQTKLHKALTDIQEPGGGWPEGMVQRAEHLLEKWKRELGELFEEEGGVWGEGSPLSGCIEVVRGTLRGWVIKMKEGSRPKDCLRSGHVGLVFTGFAVTFS